MTKTLLTSFTGLSLMALVAVFSGCTQNNTVIVPETQDVVAHTDGIASDSDAIQGDVMDTGVEAGEVVSVGTDTQVSADDTILYNSDGSIDTSNWQTYQPYVDIDVIFPRTWYYTRMDMPGAGFVSNRRHDVQESFYGVFTSSLYSDFHDNEVRLYVGSAPADIGGETDLDKALRDRVAYEKQDPVWSCVNIDKQSEEFCNNKYKEACSSTEFLGEDNRKYAVVTCEYSNSNVENNIVKYVVSKTLISQRKYDDIVLSSMTMVSTNRDLIDEGILNTSFDDFIKKILKRE